MAIGFKTFTGGTGAPPLSAADVNGYLMTQATAIFTSTTFRDAAITSPVEGQTCYTQDTNTHWIYDGAAWRPTWTQQNGASTYSQVVMQYPDATLSGTAPTSGTVSKPFAIQAGQRTVTIGAIVTNQAQVNFLQAFPNGCLSVVFSAGDSAWSGGYLVAATAGNFRIIAKNGATALTSGPVTINYIAIGF